MKYRMAIFDFDGTLADSLPRLLNILNRLAEKYRFQKIADEDVEQMRMLEMRQILKRLRIPFWKLPRVLQQLRKQMTMEADEIALFSGIDEFLNRMANQGVRLAIVSSNSWENILRILGLHNAQKFEFAECNASIFGKRRKLRNVVRTSGTPASESIYIGDELRDLFAAHAEGIAFGAVSWGYTPMDIFLPHNPQEVFETVVDMGNKLTHSATIHSGDSPLTRMNQS